LRLSLPLWNCLADEIEIVFVELLFLLALATALLLLPTLAFFRVLAFILLLVLIDDETFSNLKEILI
jgi:hypothetical protein